MDRIKNLSLDQKAKLYYMALLQKGMIDTLPEDPKAAYVRDMMDKMEEGHSDAENEKLKKISKQLKKSVKSHDKQAKTIDKITKESNDPEDDEEQAEYDKGWYGESLKEAASKLGYLKEAPVGKAGAGNPAFKINPSKVPGTAAFDKRAGLTVGGDEKVDEQDLDKIEKGVTAITGGGRRHASVSDRGDSIRVSFRYMRGEFDSEEWDKILKYLTGMGFEIKDASNYYEANYDREEPAEAVPTIYLKKNINEEAPENRDQMAGLLLKTLQQNKGEVEKAVNRDIPKEYHNKLTDFAMDDLGDVSAETYDDDPIYPTGGLSFRLAADVDPEFLGQEGDEPRYFDLNGVKIAYIGYNI